MPYGDVVIVLSTVLPIKRTLNRREIDQIILDVETRKALAFSNSAEPTGARASWRLLNFGPNLSRFNLVRICVSL